MRLRVRFTKHGKVRFTSHRDLARILERSLRRINLPVAYSEGFSPRPRLSFGLALPTGFESDAEYFDVDLVDAVEPAPLVDRLTAALPVGLAVTAAEPVPPGTGSLQQLVTSCSWRLEVLGVPAAELSAQVDRLLTATALPLRRERKGKPSTVDVRPLLLDLRIDGPWHDGVALLADLDTETVAVRPSELVELVGGTATLGRGRRLSQWITVDDARVELPPHPGPSTWHAERRAS
jgi:radical SAM-linked protein